MLSRIYLKAFSALILAHFASHSVTFAAATPDCVAPPKLGANFLEIEITKAMIAFQAEVIAADPFKTGDVTPILASAMLKESPSASLTHSTHGARPFALSSSFLRMSLNRSVAGVGGSLHTLLVSGIPNVVMPCVV